ncbi:NADH-quinone oxidoreductase subunit NuoB [Oculatella sp. LEGE 06141]|uniref:NADH-quinone oxidoreductase subunit NuoB n=1 Tax=Oculatella sp. LEGE 06141 TaxID=1828648 RepID=UPI00187F20C4|nr:NADH-quinone oxidoreductase subunit NuoB [Oculatella sp. LEGE 06141]MBE9181572.1 NADH-quinone oxidoreductase subunit NuoB [Oculatella sp. LEGE 06141]
MNSNFDALQQLNSPSAPQDQIINPIDYPTTTQQLSENVILTTVDDLYNWARLSSLWPLLYGTACCFIEFAALIGSRFDFDRFGLIPRSSPRQADLIILAGTLNVKMSQPTMRLYEQMPDPKYVIAMGACMITGGMFSADSPTAVRGADKLLPVDVYIPGCPPRPEAVIDGIIKLRKKISNNSWQEQESLGQTNRYYSIRHNMKPGSAILTGEYLRSPSRTAPPEALASSIGIPLPTSLQKDNKEAIDRGSAPD